LATSTTHQVSCSLEIDQMANVRQIAFSLVVLAAFVLVVAAPFRWW
jgi:hypothetical protein